MAGVRTNAAGRFTMRLPAGRVLAHAALRVQRRAGLAAGGDEHARAERARGVILRVAPRTASVGRSIHFSGRLRGGPIPTGGKLLVLEARSPGGAWLEFDVIRCDARGRCTRSYRFKFPGPARYQFRVLCEAEADYPFATGASNVVGVFEG